MFAAAELEELKEFLSAERIKESERIQAICKSFPIEYFNSKLEPSKKAIDIITEQATRRTDRAWSKTYLQAVEAVNNLIALSQKIAKSDNPHSYKEVLKSIVPKDGILNESKIADVIESKHRLFNR